MPYVKLVGTSDRHQSWISEIRLDEDRVIRAGVPANLSDSEKKSLEDRGFVFEKSSKSEAEEAAEAAEAVGGDITGAAPVFGDGSEDND